MTAVPAPRRPWRFRLADESGSVLPLVALLLVVLFVFAAFAVDLGNAWAQERLNQTAADGGVMAGGVTFLDDTPANNPTVVAEIQDYVNRNLGYSVPAGDWAACSDPQGVTDGFVPLTDASGSVLTPCISLKQAGTAGRAALLRVMLPDQAVDTVFARVIGMNEIQTRAFAIAELEFIGEGGALPFVLPSTPGDQHCLGTPPSGIADDPCTGPSKGKFGVINSDLHGTDDPGTPSCATAPMSTTEKLAWNTALGLDHPIFLAIDATTPNPPDVEDDCDALTTPYFVQALMFDPGNPSSLSEGIFGDGPFGTAANLPGRLRQGGGFNGDGTTSPGGTPLSGADAARELPRGTGSVFLDNVGLWKYLVRSGSGDFCDGVTYDLLVGKEATDRLEMCLASGSAEFVDEILTSPRFALVPQLFLDQAALDATTPGTAVNIKDFIPVYLQATFFNCNAGAPPQCMVFTTDDAVPLDREFFAPGEGTLEGCVVQGGGCKNNVNLDLEGITAFVLDRSWVPEEAFGGGPEEDMPVSVLMYR